MKSSWRGEGADYPNKSIIKFEIILKNHRKKTKQSKRPEGPTSAAQGKHTKHRNLVAPAQLVPLAHKYPISYLP